MRRKKMREGEKIRRIFEIKYFLLPCKLPLELDPRMIGFHHPNDIENVRINNTNSSNDKCHLIFSNPSWTFGHVLRSFHNQNYSIS